MTINKIENIRKYFIIILSVAFMFFHLYTAAFGLLEGISQRNIHLTFALLLVFLVHPSKTKKVGLFVDIILILTSLAAGIYMFIEAPDLAWRAGTVYKTDILFCAILIVLILTGVKRTMGPVMSIIAIVMLLYVLFGQSLPQPFGHPKYTFERITSLMYLGSEGIWSTPIAASATFIVLFIMFGCLLEAFGGGAFFMDLSMALCGWLRGGPAKVAVISSMLMGSISGSAVANVTTTGAFTIPLMKKTGYDKNFAGAVEAVASTGGQLAPPVMGASAFLMAEILAIPYSQIIIAAAIPAILYYFSCFFVVDLEAGKRRLICVPRSQLPILKDVLRKGWYHLLPLVALVYMLVIMKTSALRASLWAIILILAIGFVTTPKTMDGLKETMKKLLDSAISSSKSILQVAMATACAGIIIGSFAVTGLGAKLSSLIIMLAGEKLFLVLIYTAITSIILGMGLPTVAAYIILAILIAPALTRMGVLPIAAHLFIFYFGIMSNITPPVAIAAYAAAGLSGGAAMKTGLIATRLAVAGFTIPFVMIYDTSILMIGKPLDIIIVSMTALLGIYSLSICTTGYLFKECSILERIICGIAGVLLIIPNTIISLIGLGLLVIVFIIQYSSRNRELKII